MMTSLRGLFTALLVLFEIVVAGTRVFALDGLRAGLIDVRPLNRVTRLLALIGLLLVFGFLFSLVFGDVLRLNSSLQLLTYASSAVRGLLAPSVAVPLTLLAVALGWTYILTGALHVRRAARWFALALYILYVIPGLGRSILTTATTLDMTTTFTSIGGAACLSLLILFAFALLPHLHWPLAVEFSVLWLCNSLLFLLAYAQVVIGAQRTLDAPFNAGDLVTELVLIERTLLIPFLFVAGVEMVNFGRDVSGWGGKTLQRFASARMAKGLLLALLAYRGYGFARSWLSEGISAQQVNAWLGAAALAAGLWLILRWRQRKAIGDSVPMKLVLALIFGTTSSLILLTVILQWVPLLFILIVILTQDPSAMTTAGFFETVDALSQTYGQIALLVTAILGVIIALAAMRRGRYTVAAFGWIVAWSRGLGWLTEPERALARWHFEYADVDVSLWLALTAVTLFWLARGQLTRTRALRLFVLALLAALLNQTGFLDNPFSPLFSFAGIFFLAFGILWSVLTAGGRFLNDDSKNFPRASRVLMYLGYVLLSVSIAHWYNISHDVANQTLQSDFTTRGFVGIGLPLAYLAFVEGGRSLVGTKE